MGQELLKTEVPHNFKYSGGRMDSAEMLEFCAPYIHKLTWFYSKGYEPHYYQQLFHCMHGTDGQTLRFRHLVAGRRGGKTLSAAWELLYAVLFPSFFHWEAHGIESDRPIYAWVLFKDNPTGKAAWDTFREVCRAAGLVHGREYKENRSNKWFEFENGAFVHFRTADDPESLRGAGLDIMWIDEAAFIPNNRAWEVSRPALSDHQGLLMTTTTPDGKNWLYDEWWSDEAQGDPNIGRVEYRSIDNPFFPKEEWDYLIKTYHPMVFRQEFMASFDAMQGRELLGEWLKYYTMGEASGDKISVPRDPRSPNKYALTYFMGVDPAISLSDKADRFAMALIGVTLDNSQVFLWDLFAGRIPFPEQIDKIQEWHIKYRPQIIGIESNAFQQSLEQQVARLPGLPPTIPIFSKTKKVQRILGMSRLFKIGKVRIREDHRDFIDEWLDYDSTISNPKDDCLDAVEIALGAAGVLLPMMPSADLYDDDKRTDIESAAIADLPGNYKREDHGAYDPMFGAD